MPRGLVISFALHSSTSHMLHIAKSYKHFEMALFFVDEKSWIVFKQIFKKLISDGN